MAYAGKEIYHPIAQERAIFLQTASDTNGELMQQDVFMPPGGFVTVEHIHPKQEERFEVREGKIKMKVNGEEQTVEAGESRVVPAGTAHIWWNPFDQEAVVRCDFRPALRIEYLFENIAGLAKDGKVYPKGHRFQGLPKPIFQSAIFVSHYWNELYFARPRPFFFQRMMFGFLALIGRLCGYKAHYAKYED